MNNIAELTAEQVITLAERLTHADLEGCRVRILTGTDKHGPWVKWAIGGGMWTPAQYNAATWKD